VLDESMAGIRVITRTMRVSRVTGSDHEDTSRYVARPYCFIRALTAATLSSQRSHSAGQATEGCWPAMRASTPATTRSQRGR
jgi:hypothetical protein